MNAKNTFIARAEIVLEAKPARVWEALTRPELIKQYLFGTKVTTNWQPGSPILYRGIWQGKAYEDKGVVLEFVPQEKLVSTFWSALSGLEDVPENYKTVGYELSTAGAQTRLVITQDNNASEEESAHSEQNWKMVMEGLKKVVEG